MRIMVVDDSVVFRSQIKAALDGVDGIVVSQIAANGKIGLEKLEQSQIDVVILDLEMPEMDGMTMLQEMRKRGFAQKVIIFSSTNKSAIDAVFSALNAGASDFITKPQNTGSLEDALKGVKEQLVPKVLQFKKKTEQLGYPKNLVSSPLNEFQPNKSEMVVPTLEKIKLTQFKPRAIAIGASTGGPNAITAVFARLRDKKIHTPIFIAQHMPPQFTKHFAQSLAAISGQPVFEAEHGTLIKAGHVYVAPGDFHMTVRRDPDGSSASICLDQGPKRNSVRPAVDNLFESMAQIYGSFCGAFILTGMGEDGVLGARAIKNASGAVVIQDEASSVVWGMPGAVYAAGCYDSMADLDICAKILIDMIC